MIYLIIRQLSNNPAMLINLPLIYMAAIPLIFKHISLIDIYLIKMNPKESTDEITLVWLIPILSSKEQSWSIFMTP